MEKIIVSALVMYEDFGPLGVQPTLFYPSASRQGNKIIVDIVSYSKVDGHSFNSFDESLVGYLSELNIADRATSAELVDRYNSTLAGTVKYEFVLSLDEFKLGIVSYLEAVEKGLVEMVENNEETT